MLPQVYETPVIYYEPYWADRPLGVGEVFLPGGGHPDPRQNYHQDFRTPPRVYDQALAPDPFIVLFCRRQRSLHSEITVCLFFIMDHVEWPGNSFYIDEWDGTTGEFIRRNRILNEVTTDFPITANVASVDRLGMLWITDSGATLRQIGLSDFQETGLTYEHDHFEHEVTDAYAIDTTLDRIISTAPAGEPVIYVQKLSTGETEFEIRLGGAARQIFLEDTARVYCALDNALLVLIDYLSGKIMGVYKCPTDDQEDSGPSRRRFAWDALSRKILVAQKIPDDENGASNTKVKGYFPHPQAVALTPPMATLPARATRRVNVVSRAYGDAGEAISGQYLVNISTGDGTVRPQKIGTGLRGYASFFLESDEPGSQNVYVESEQDV